MAQEATCGMAELWHWAQIGQVDELRRALQDPSTRGSLNRTFMRALVHVAAANGWCEAVALLLQAHMSPYVHCAELASCALRAASISGMPSVAALVLSSSAVQHPWFGGVRTRVRALQAAAGRGHDGVVRALLENTDAGILTEPRGPSDDEDSDDDEGAQDGETAGDYALSKAFQFEQTSTVQVLLNFKASPRNTVVQGFWFLREGHGPALQLLLAAGMSPTQTFGGNSLLERAVVSWDRSMQVVELLMNAKADVGFKEVSAAAAPDHMRYDILRRLVRAAGCRPEDLDSVLDTVGLAGCARSAALLFKAGARATQRGLWYAENNMEALELLLQCKADVRQRAPDLARPPLFLATSPRAVELLLAAGASLHEREPGGRTVLNYAAGRQFASDVPTGVVQALLDAKADPCETTGAARYTPLHYWSMNPLRGKSIDVLLEAPRALISAKADVAVPDAAGNTVLHMCCRTPTHLRAVKFLVASKAPVDRLDAYGRTPLTILARTATGSDGLFVAAQHLLEAKADPNGWSGGELPPHVTEVVVGTTPVHECCAYAARQYTWAVEFMRLLLAAKADPDRADCSGRTPLHLLVSMYKGAVFIGLDDDPDFWGPAQALRQDLRENLRENLRHDLHYNPCRNVAVEAVTLLVDAKADVRAKDDNGRTVLARLLGRAVHGQARALPATSIGILASVLVPAYRDASDFKRDFDEACMNLRAAAAQTSVTEWHSLSPPPTARSLRSKLRQVRAACSQHFATHGASASEQGGAPASAVTGTKAPPTKRTRKTAPGDLSE